MAPKSMTKDDATFIKLFEELNKIKVLTHTIANEKIKKHYPSLPFLNKGTKTAVYIRPIVKWKMTNMADNQSSIEKIFELIDNVYPKLYANFTTLDNYFTSDVRQPVFKRFPNIGKENSIQYQLAKEMVALPDDIKGTLLKEASSKVEAKNRDYDIVDAEEMFNIMKDNIVSEDVFRRAIALLLCCGSREMELFATSSFKVLDVPSGEKNWVIQDKVSKKKGVDVSVKKPILYLSAEKFIKEVASMRKDLNIRYKKILEDGTLSSTISTAGNKMAHEIFQNRKGFTMHVCRKIYAHLSYDIYESKPTIHGKGTTLAFWIQSVLAHEGQKAVASYSHIKLKHRLNAVDVPARTEELITKVDQLEERMDTLNISDQEEKPLKIAVVKNQKLENQIKKVQQIYDAFFKKNEFYPNQSKMEVLAKEVATRATIRLFMKKQDD